jgi:hypothetical protein
MRKSMRMTMSSLVVLSVIFFLLETSLPPVSSTCSFEQAVRGRLYNINITISTKFILIKQTWLLSDSLVRF